MNRQLSPFEKRQAEKQRLAARRRARQRKRLIGFFVLLLVFAVFVTAVVFIIRSVSWDALFGQVAQKGRSPSDGNLLYGPELSYYDPLEATTEYVTVPHDAIYQGELILVNAQTPFHFELWEEPCSVYDYKTASYSVRDKNIRLSRATIDALNRFFDAFSKATGVNDLMINSAYRSKEEQQQVWDDYLRDYGEEYTRQYVSVPGFSEHHSGLAMDVATYNARGITAVRNEGSYAWLYENMAQYGFILRYPQNKTVQTGINFESWHFRYVTIPHALLISEQNYCLEEYLDYIRIYTYEGAHAKVSAADGTNYAIYFYEATDAVQQQIPVPKGVTYQILGNNTDGFLISYQVLASVQEGQS